MLHGRRRGPATWRRWSWSAIRSIRRVAPNVCAPSTFPSFDLPCLFVSGRRDAFATPEELERETAAIPGPVTRVVVDGDHSLRKSEAEVAEIVADWVAGLSPRA